MWESGPGPDNAYCNCSEENRMKIGFVGLGKMGGNMVERLLKGGHEIVAFDPIKEALKEAQNKGAPNLMFRNVLSESIHPNILVLRVQPDERITLTFQTKVPGARVCLQPVTMDFHYSSVQVGTPLGAYKKVILDCLLGDHMLFVRQDGVEECWAFLSPILDACETCKNREHALHLYEAGTWGPREADDLMRHEGCDWRMA